MKKNIIILIVLAVVVIGALMFFYLKNNQPGNGPVTFKNLVGNTPADYENFSIKFTPLRTYADNVLDRGRVPSYIVRSRGSGIAQADFERLSFDSVDFSNDLTLKILEFPSENLMQFVESIKDVDGLTSSNIPDQAVMSMVLLKKSGTGWMSYQAIVDLEHVDSLTSRLTNAAIGTPVFTDLLHWEMNIP